MSSNHIITLPTEVLWNVAEQLDSASVHTFVSLCKATYYIGFQTEKRSVIAKISRTSDMFLLLKISPLDGSSVQQASCMSELSHEIKEINKQIENTLSVLHYATAIKSLIEKTGLEESFGFRDLNENYDFPIPHDKAAINHFGFSLVKQIFTLYMNKEAIENYNKAYYARDPEAGSDYSTKFKALCVTITEKGFAKALLSVQRVREGLMTRRSISQEYRNALIQERPYRWKISGTLIHNLLEKKNFSEAYELSNESIIGPNLSFEFEQTVILQASNTHKNILEKGAAQEVAEFLDSLSQPLRDSVLNKTVETYKLAKNDEMAAMALSYTKLPTE